MATTEDDSLIKLKNQLTEVIALEKQEAYISQELKQLGHNFTSEKDNDSEAFFESMATESNERAKKLVAYRNRLQSVADRLATFLSPKATRAQVYDWAKREWIHDSFD